ncbi:MAG: hypothetical protein N2Z72_04660 [Bacteroidales bacterium]|nr:hypothetical protein [Bacteroidales bacterium]
MNIMFNAHFDMERLKAHEQFRRYFLQNIRRDDVFNINFDSLPIITWVSPSDEQFRIFTYAFPLEDNARYEIYGYMVIRGKPNKVVELKNIKLSPSENPEKTILKNGNWYPAVYYQLVEEKYKGEKYFLLIGWNGENPFYREKIIETLGFDFHGMPVFGKNYFKGKGYGQKKRIILRYSPEALVIARYQSITYRLITTTRKEKKQKKDKKNKNDFQAQKGWTKKTTIKEINENLVVFDNLAPIAKDFEGMFSFYFPRDDMMNGLRFKKGKWEHVPLTNIVVERNTRKVEHGITPPDWKKY